MSIGTIVLAERDFSSSANDLGVWQGIQDILYEKTNDKKAYDADEISINISDIQSND